jgi:outer membrane protein assembly factor BamB
MRLLSWCLLTAALWSSVSPTGWPQWRGPDRDGRSSETGLLQRWPAGGPRVIWHVNGVGQGFSSVAVAGGRIYTQGQAGGRQHVAAFDANSGARLWLTPSGAPFQESAGNGPRATPTLDGDRVYALAADGTLACLNAHTGATVWSVNLVSRFGASIPKWGFSESPLIDGNWIIVRPGAPGAGVVSLDKMTGRIRWKAGDDEAGYSSVMLAEVGGVRQAIALSGESVSAIDVNTGAVLWRDAAIGKNSIATPVLHQGHLFVSNFYGGGGMLLKLAPTSMSEIYFTRDLKNHYSSSVLVADTLYGFNDTILSALDFATGKVAWRTRNLAKGSLIYADGHLYVLAEDGVLALVQATPRAFAEVSRFTIDIGPRPAWSPFWSPPALAGGRLYLRVQDHLICYDIAS